MTNNDHAQTQQAPLRISDTADWKQIIYISEKGISVYLKNIENPTIPVASVFSREWDNPGEKLLDCIENAVYDYPQMMDDFSTDIVIEAPKALWAPAEALEYEGAEEKIYTSVYTAEPEDIMTDEVDDMVCLYCLTPGLKPFLSRTFPGTRIKSHLSPVVAKFRERISEMPRIYIDIRENAADFYAFDGRQMLMCATHAWFGIEDIAYHLFNIIDVYGLDSANTEVSLSGCRKEKKELLTLLRKHMTYVMLTMLPRPVDENMQLAAALCLNRAGAHGKI